MQKGRRVWYNMTGSWIAGIFKYYRDIWSIRR